MGKNENFFNDFLIVAMASVSNLDIVCSQDNKTMKSAKALKAYKTVNSRNNIRTPQFIAFKEFEKLV